MRKLRVRYMPPAGAPRPDAQTYNSLISHFETSLDRAAAARPNPGRTDTFRRLNRTEYQNSVRDLLAVELDVTAMLPKDDSSHGFDNLTVGELSPTLLERYLGAARKISRLAVGTPVKAPLGETILIPARPDPGRPIRGAALRHARRRFGPAIRFRRTVSTKSSSG